MQDYDKEGDYIRTWVPELAKIPAPSIFEPWRLSNADQQKFGVQIGVGHRIHILPTSAFSCYSQEFPCSGQEFLFPA
jgi:hypothetical protein